VRTARAAFAALALWAASTALGAFTPPPAPTRWATDTAGFISESTRRALDARLESYQRDTGRHVVVWIAPTTGGEPLEEWTVRTAQAWGIGSKNDDGLALFVFAQDRKLRIEVGYGLEGVLPDVVASRIIQEVAIPRLRAGDPDAAITATVGALLERLGGESSPPPTPDPYERVQRRRASPANLILFGIVGAIFLILMITNPRLAMFLLFSMMSGGHRRGGWGGGGGFGGGGGYRGGGGRFGGGGASGSW
jgi:uncharacterized protein